MGILNITVFIQKDDLSLVTAGNKPTKLWTSIISANNSGYDTTNLVQITVEYTKYQSWVGGPQLLND